MRVSLDSNSIVMKIKLASLLVSLNLIFSLSQAQVALNFNGVNNYVSTNGSPVLNNQSRTVDTWIKTTSTVTTQKTICDWGAMTPNGSRFTLNMINSKLRIEVGGVGIVGTTNINTGLWTHVSAVYESSITTGPNVFLYINGLLELSGNFTGYATLTTTTTTGFRIGTRLDGINLFEGAIDEVKVYNYARTQVQVAADTLEYCGPQAGLVAYYKLNEGIPNGSNTASITAFDYSGFGNNGTLNSFTLSGTSSNWVPGRVTSGAPSISVSPGTNLCSGGTVTLTANATTNFTWSTGNTTSSVIVVSPTSSGTYSIVATNVLNCMTTTSINITINNAVPSLTVLIAQNPICLGAATSFSASGAATYSWTGGVINGQAFSPTQSGNYTLTAANGCGSVSSVQSITVVPLAITALASPTSVCAGYTVNLSATSIATGYTWAPGGQSGANIVVSPISSSIYTVSASNGTCSGTQTLQITTKTTPSISISSTLITLCNGQSATLSASGAGTNGTYSWSPGGGTGANISISPTTNTIYTAYGTNSLGCTSSAQIPVVVLSKPSVSIISSKTLACSGETITLNATGANTYTWSTGVFTASTSVSPITGLNIYTVTAASSNNSCTATQTFALAVITPSVNYTSSVAVCAGASATLNASGATTYSWNSVSAGTLGQVVYTPNSTSTFTLVASTQSLNATCLSTYVSTVLVNPIPSMNAVADKTISICRGVSNTLTATGALTYTWSGLNSNAAQVIVTPSTTTTYTVFGSSSAGCEGNAQVQVKVTICSGITEIATTSVFEVYPNPAKNEIHIKSDILMLLELLDMNGRLIKMITINTGDCTLDISSLSRGMYLLKAKDQTSNFYKKISIED